MTVIIKGRDLLRGTSPLNLVQVDAILAAIEAEARTALLAELRVKVEELHHWGTGSIPPQETDTDWVSRAAVLALLSESAS